MISGKSLGRTPSSSQHNKKRRSILGREKRETRTIITSFQTDLGFDSKIGAQVPLGMRMHPLPAHGQYLTYRVTMDDFNKLVLHLGGVLERQHRAGIPVSATQQRTVRSVLETLGQAVSLENGRRKQMEKLVQPF